MNLKWLSLFLVFGSVAHADLPSPVIFNLSCTKTGIFDLAKHECLETAIPSSAPGGSSGFIQYNNGSGGFAGDSGLTYSAGNLYLSGLINGTIDPTDEWLLDSGGTHSVDWGNRLLTDSNIVTSLDWQNRYLYDGGGNVSLDWSIYALEGPGGIQILNWSNQEAYDTSSNLSIDWSSYRGLYDSSSQPSVAWDQRQLEANGFSVIDWSENSFGGASFDSGAAHFDGSGNLTAGGLISSTLYVTGATNLDGGFIHTDGAGDMGLLSLAATSTISAVGITSTGGVNISSGNLAVQGFTQMDSSAIQTSGSGLFNKYNAATLAGVGMASILGSKSLLTQAASISTTNLINAGGNAPSGLYRLSGYVECTTAGTAGDTLTVTITYHDDNGAQSITPVSAMSLSTLGFSTIQVPIRASGGNTINFATTVSSVAGSPKYDLFLTLERIQ